EETDRQPDPGSTHGGDPRDRAEPDPAVGARERSVHPVGRLLDTHHRAPGPLTLAQVVLGGVLDLELDILVDLAVLPEVGPDQPALRVHSEDEEVVGPLLL